MENKKDYSGILNLNVFRVYCAKNYYGGDCNTFCVPADDSFKGHYKCDLATGVKICLKGWKGKNCLEGKFP